MAALFKLLLAAALLVLASGSGLPGPDIEAVSKFPPIGSIKLYYYIGEKSFPALNTSLYQALTLLSKRWVVETVPVLAPQTSPEGPPTWLLVQVNGRVPAKEHVTLAVRNDNVYVAGFQTPAGTWFAFETFKQQITGSTVLPLKESYGDLIGGHTELTELDVGKEAALEAVRFLSSYSGQAKTPALGRSLATLIVIVSETARFKRVYATVKEAQEGSTVRLTKEETKLVVVWGELSKALINFSQTKKWDQQVGFTRAGVRDPAGAVASLQVCLRPKGAKPPTGGNTRL